MPLTAERQRFYRYRKAQAVHKYLLEHPCVDCGEADPVVLDFDHVRGEKLHNVKRMLAGTYSLKKVLEEIEKCDVRCANCHRRITAKRGGFFAYLGLDLKDPGSRTKKIENACGTRTGYRRGCRCILCREAQRIAAQNFRNALRSGAAR